MSLLELPHDKRDAIVSEFGAGGRAWIENFPALVRWCVDRWQLKLLDIASQGLPINVIYFAETADGNPVVLKVGHPHPEQRTEMIALACYDGHFTPKVLDCDAGKGAILMERIVPGTTFRAYADSIERSRLVPSVLGKLSRQVEDVGGLPTFDDWIERGFAGFRYKFGDSHVFNEHIARAQDCYQAICARHPARWLLHGDLHHENILADDERGWCAIDPKGVIGPLPMETGRFLHNFPEDEVEGATTIAEVTVDQLCEVLEVRYQHVSSALNMARSDAMAAAYVDCVLSTCWTLTGAHKFDGMVRVDATRKMLD